jgi:predicted nucleotidyltransferase
MLMKSVHDIKQALTHVAPAVFGGTPVLFAYLYGSYAVGTVHPFSDLDIAVYVEGLDERSCLNLELSLGLLFDEKLEHAVQSDVRVLNRLPLTVKGKILTDGELIYSISEERRIELESQVRRSYFDFLPVMHQYQDAYRNKLLELESNGLR